MPNTGLGVLLASLGWPHLVRTEMPYNLDFPNGGCTVCNRKAKIDGPTSSWDLIVDCVCCGEFQISKITADELGLPYKTPKEQALASHLIRKMQAPRYRPILNKEFFDALRHQTLPTPMEASDNLLIWLAGQQDGRPGNEIEIAHADPPLLGTLGVVEPEDVGWIVDSLKSQDLLLGGYPTAIDDRRRPRMTVANRHIRCRLTARGWERFEELTRAHISASYAFFARRFSNTELDQVFERCLYPAGLQTGYELRTVPQRAGLIDAVIENEIRRCRFLVADLSDENAGAYWEAGFAEGLEADRKWIE